MNTSRIASAYGEASVGKTVARQAADRYQDRCCTAWQETILDNKAVAADQDVVAQHDGVDAFQRKTYRVPERQARHFESGSLETTERPGEPRLETAR